ncbi:uncharacterized protein LOC142615491 [Castanea sativa]|uniref:uncharacterized protein LOC142615491 n=1 Tax=Castanea sativa TaxID=21020 RepID=UPI003F64D1A7
MTTVRSISRFRPSDRRNRHRQRSFRRSNVDLFGECFSICSIYHSFEESSINFRQWRKRKRKRSMELNKKIPFTPSFQLHLSCCSNRSQPHPFSALLVVCPHPFSSTVYSEAEMMWNLSTIYNL